MSSYILTVSCQDVRGIVQAVSSFISDCGGFIDESEQFGDESTNRFFMRVDFALENCSGDEFKEKFAAQIAGKFGMEWNLYEKNKCHKVLVMASKSSHCLIDILHRQKTGWLNIEVPCIVSNHPDLEEIANWYKTPFYHLPVTPENKPEQEAKLLELVEKHDVDLVALARYMQILSPDLCEKLAGKAINIHHSFLPSFKGAKPYHQAYERGVKIIGATAHYVTSDLDEGPIIEQEVARVNHKRKPEDLVAMGHDIERQVLAKAIKYYTEHRVLLNGIKTVVFK